MLFRSFASFQGARIHTSCSSALARITGIALEWIGSTIAVGDVVSKPYLPLDLPDKTGCKAIKLEEC